MITHIHVLIAWVHAIILYTSVYPSVYCTLPVTHFLVFEGWFLEAPQAVLLHATVIHCHYGIDIKDASFFILE